MRWGRVRHTRRIRTLVIAAAGMLATGTLAVPPAAQAYLPTAGQCSDYEPVLVDVAPGGTSAFREDSFCSFVITCPWMGFTAPGCLLDASARATVLSQGPDQPWGTLRLGVEEWKTSTSCSTWHPDSVGRRSVCTTAIDDARVRPGERITVYCSLGTNAAAVDAQLSCRGALTVIPS